MLSVEASSQEVVLGHVNVEVDVMVDVAVDRASVSVRRVVRTGVEVLFSCRWEVVVVR